jgi:hypothetical protein
MCQRPWQSARQRQHPLHGHVRACRGKQPIIDGPVTKAGIVPLLLAALLPLAVAAATHDAHVSTTHFGGCQWRPA